MEYIEASRRFAIVKCSTILKIFDCICWRFSTTYRVSFKSAKTYTAINLFTPANKIWFSRGWYSWNSCCSTKFVKNFYVDTKQKRHSGLLLTLGHIQMAKEQTRRGLQIRSSLFFFTSSERLKEDGSEIQYLNYILNKYAYLIVSL